jgi:hypothetical protein
MPSGVGREIHAIYWPGGASLAAKSPRENVPYESGDFGNIKDLSAPWGYFSELQPEMTESSIPNFIGPKTATASQKAQVEAKA